MWCSASCKRLSPAVPAKTSEKENLFLATISIDLARKMGIIDRKIYGGFVEHLGRCIYGGIYEEGSPLSDEHGFRKDVLAAVHDLQLPILRWPGGNFVSAYHWTDGIGPVEKRPKHMELAWHSTESNRFGRSEEHTSELQSRQYLVCRLLLEKTKIVDY